MTNTHLPLSKLSHNLSHLATAPWKNVPPKASAAHTNRTSVPTFMRCDRGSCLTAALEQYFLFAILMMLSNCCNKYKKGSPYTTCQIRDAAVSQAKTMTIRYACTQIYQMVMVTTYTDLDRLAHTPKGSQGEGLYTFALNLRDGTLRKRGVLPLTPNPAFLVKHPRLPLIYGTTECIDGPGEVFSLNMDARSEAGVKITGRTDAGGRSTCYLNISKGEDSLTVVNYWDARVCVLPLDVDSGATGLVAHTYMQAGAEYVDEKNPDRTEHWQYRQRWPHTHCAGMYV
jgi:hypothetical protein